MAQYKVRERPQAAHSYFGDKEGLKNFLIKQFNDKGVTIQDYEHDPIAGHFCGYTIPSIDIYDYHIREGYSLVINSGGKIEHLSTDVFNVIYEECGE